jgi:hypothetical protein
MSIVSKLFAGALALGGSSLLLAGVANAAPAPTLLGGDLVGVVVDGIAPNLGVEVCGISVGLLGDAAGTCPTDAAPAVQTTASGSTALAAPGTTASAPTLPGVLDAVVSGVVPDVQATVCGISVGALGNASGTCPTGSSASSSGSGIVVVPPSGGPDLLSGTVSGIAPHVGLTVCGVSVGVLGGSTSTCPTAAPLSVDPTPPVTPTDPTDPTDPTNPTDPTVTDDGGEDTVQTVAAVGVAGDGELLAATTGGGLTGTLPFTGAPVGQLAAAAGGLLAVGAVLARVRPGLLRHLR